MCSLYHRETRLWLGLVAFVVGAVMLLERFDLVPSETWNYLWPAILIVTGLKWMVGGACKTDSCCSSSTSCECGTKDCDGSCEMPMDMPTKKVNTKKSRKK